MAPKIRSQGLIYINGVRHEIGADFAGWMLADYLRRERQLTGTKIVCAEGDCGACTVLRFFPGIGRKKLGRSARFLPINSCITTMAQLDGSSLITVDALTTGKELTPVQEAMKTCHGSQCGFCTPGFVMALTGLVEKKREERAPGIISEKEARNALTGNLCRCTGYQQILDAAVSIPLDSCQSVAAHYYSEKQDRELRLALSRALKIESAALKIQAPVSLRAAVSLMGREKKLRLLGSGTDLGVAHNKGKLELSNILSLHLIPELYQIKARSGKLWVGARVTIEELRTCLQDLSSEAARFLDLFASPQIKNIASLVGNIANASPIADTPPFLLACDAILHLHGSKGKRSIPLKDFYLGYKKTALKNGELVAGVELKLPSSREAFGLYKVSERKDLDISSVNAGFLVRRDGEKIQEARIAYGGIAATPVRIDRLERLMEGSIPSPLMLERSIEVLQEEIHPISDLRGSAAFRRVLAANLLRRFFREKLGVIS